ncbi:hypothetical protein SANTM175S_08310 [Streptomyces antimycoticus]
MCLPPLSSEGLARMFSGTSLLYSGSETSNVRVCGIPMVLPVAVLFSKTMVVFPATAVVGAEAYLVMSSPAVQVRVCCAACRVSFCPWAAVAVAELSPRIMSSAARRGSQGLLGLGRLRFTVTPPSWPDPGRAEWARRRCR